MLWELPNLAAGLAASYAGSVSVDDYSGGVAAGEWLAAQLPGARCAVLAGPDDDARNRLRLAGFLAVHPKAGVIKAGSWFFDEAVRAAPQVMGFAGVFCANDRLASAVVETMKSRSSNNPLVVGFDDAPVAEKLDFTTIAIPWEDIAAAAVDVARRRMAGDVRTAAALTFAPRPIVREGASGLASPTP